MKSAIVYPITLKLNIQRVGQRARETPYQKWMLSLITNAMISKLVFIFLGTVFSFDCLFHQKAMGALSKNHLNRIQRYRFKLITNLQL